jgi:hypothetical protein
MRCGDSRNPHAVVDHGAPARALRPLSVAAVVRLARMAGMCQARSHCGSRTPLFAMTVEAQSVTAAASGLQPAAPAEPRLEPGKPAAPPVRLARKVCPICGRWFGPARSNQKYCATACRSRAAEERRRERQQKAGSAASVSAQKRYDVAWRAHPRPKTPVLASVADRAGAVAYTLRPRAVVAWYVAACVVAGVLGIVVARLLAGG